MKKAFLFLTMLLFAFMGTMRADEVTVCDGTATNDYVPVYGFYADTQGCQSEFVIPASEIGILPGGQISKLTFYLSTPATAAWTATFQVYMTEIEGTTLSAFVGPSGCTQVYQGALNGTGSTMEVVFDNDYTYNGGNLLIGTFVSTAGNYKSAYFYGVTAAGASIQRNSSGASTSQRNFLPKTTFEFVQGDLPATTIVPSENPVQLGVRPIGAWMKPYELAITNQGTPTTVTGVDGTANFAVEAEVPYALGYNGTMPISVTTTGTPAAGTLNGQVLVSYSDRTFTTIDATAEMYEPVDGDVWEMAEEVTAMPFQGNAPTGIYRNYELGQADDAADAVYKVTFDNDVLFSAGTNGAGAKTRLYTEDFNGVGGPDADNNYVYNGPTVNPGPMQMWFAYAYSGTNTWYGLSAGGGYYYGYQIPASYIEELGLAGTSITTVEAAARESYDYECYIVKGGATPFDGELVSFGVAENPQAMYFFDINLEEPVLVDEGENIWVIFYSDSPYAAYCGRTPVDATNGKIWTYNPNATSPAWSSNTSYTPVIYTRFLELPTGREVTVDLGSMKIKEGNGVASEIAAVDGTAMGVSKAQMYNEAKAQNTRGNRDTQTLIEEGWEDGIGDWTMNNCISGTGVYTGDANSGSNCFRFKWTTNTPQYLISPELADNNGGTISFYCKRDSYDESYKVGYSTTTNDPSAFTFGTEVTEITQLYAEQTATFPAGTKYIAIASTAYDAFYFFVDDITITADVTSGGGSTDPVYQIADMYVPAGTYYVAVASKTENFQVDMMTTEVPAPEQAVVVSPYDGETNVSDPYLAEWILGDYTTEMQVLFGTQYPPQTALIDWTDYLVESAFLMDLEPNQSYFLQVNERNVAGTTEGEIIAFTTPIDPVEGFEVAEANLYPGDAAVFTWDANRSFKGYNLYMYDGVEITKVNDALITENTYSVEGLEYNMTGYEFAVTAVYDAGESDYSDVVTVYMTGNGIVSGTVYDQDSITVVPNAIVEFRGIDAYGATQVISTTTDENGVYTCDVLEGNFTPVAYKEGYAECSATAMTVAYGETYNDVNIYIHEFYYPLGMITATEEDADVLVEWSWTPAEMVVDFETGDFSQADFTLPASYPWEITTTNPYEGTYAMKSTCAGIASGISTIEATVDVPYDGLMGFWVKVSTEANYDKFNFYIDGVQQGGSLSGDLAYSYKEFAVTEGTHTYKWEYAKDSSVNSNDDCVYVDNIYMYKQAGPAPSGMTYTFDGSSMEGWTSLDADGDGYGWMLGSACDGTYLSGGNLAGTGHNSSADLVTSGSYSNVYGVLTPDNYLVSPAKIAAQDGAAITFWACAQDASYAAEHFGVAVSTGSNTSAADFTTIQEWTMTAKSARLADENNLVRGTRAQGSWYEYTVDLSAYAGQEIWVAIRHFNCSDQFLFNVDDITLGDGSEDVIARNDRTFQSFNLYRRNNVGDAEPELIATPAADVFEYTDAEWATLPYGEWQWGIQATYEGNAPVPNRDSEVYTYTFDSGLEGWTNIDADNDGNVWFNSTESQTYSCYDYSTYGHNGTGCFMISQSYTDCTYDAYAANNFLVSPQKYPIDANSSISFWQDWANDSYPDYYEVMVSTADNPGASDFTSIWTIGTKNHGNGAKIRNTNNRFENWTEYNVSLAAYAGQEVWIAFHHQDYDNYELWLDDVTITAAGSAPVPPTPTGDGLSEILWSNVIDKDMEATMTFNVSLNNAQSADGAVVTLVGENNEYAATVADGTAEMIVRKGDNYTITVALEGYASYTATEFVEEDEYEYNVVLQEVIAPVAGLYVSPTGWAMWEVGSVGPVPPTPGDDDSFTEGFEGGLNGWTNIIVNADGGEWLHSTEQPYGHDYSELAHTGTGFALCYSFVDYTGAFDTDAYLVTPQKYNIVDGSTLTFWADNANDTYPEAFSVCVATADAPTAADFTEVWSGEAKGTVADKANVRHNETRYDNWREHTIDLSAYAGQSVWIAFHDVNYDAYEIWIDDVELAVANKGDRAPLSYKVMLDGEYVGETTYPFYQHDVEGMEEGSVHVTSVAALYASGMGEWMTYEWTYTSCSNFAGVTDFTSAVDNNTVTLNWTLPGGGSGGSASTFTEGFEGGMPEGWTVVDANNDGYTWCMTSNIPSTWTYYASLTLDWYRTGTNAICSGSYINGAGALNPDEYLIMGQQNIANGSTLSFWAAATDASYPADHFGVAVSDDATSWTMVQEWTLTGKEGAANGGRESRDGKGAKLGSWYNYTVDLSAYAGQKYIAIRHFNCYDQYIMCVDDIELGVANKGGVRSNRDMWDLLGTFNAAEGGHYGVVTDGEYIYTSNWGYSSAAHNFYKYDMDGNVIEGFEIPGCGTLRGMTFDGQYVYGVANSSTIYCVDLNNHTLVGTTTSAYGAMRGITYDPARDGFWVIGNWSGNLTLIDRTGAIVQAGPAPTSASDLAYYADPDGVEHVFCFNNGTNDVDDYNIATNTITPAVFNFSNTPGFDGGSSGGCHVATYAGKTAFFGDIQQSPNLIGIYELDGNAPVPPQPVEGIVGAVLFRDGEFVGMFGANTTTYTEELEEAGQYTYTIRVIYDGDPDVTYYAMSCGDDETVTIIDAVEDNDEVISSIYPNPTSGDLYITATAMKHVTVFNTMGQVVFSSDVNTDSYVLNMGQLEAGVYMVKVDAAQGSSVKRIAVVK